MRQYTLCQEFIFRLERSKLEGKASVQQNPEIIANWLEWENWKKLEGAHRDLILDCGTIWYIQFYIIINLKLSASSLFHRNRRWRAPTSMDVRHTRTAGSTTGEAGCRATATCTSSLRSRVHITRNARWSGVRHGTGGRGTRTGVEVGVKLIERECIGWSEVKDCKDETDAGFFFLNSLLQLKRTKS